MAEMNAVTAINQTLSELMAEDARVVLLGEDVGKNGGVFRVTEGLWNRFGARRVVDTPLAESAIVGSAIGMAIGGLRPIAEIQFMGFLYPALNQIFSHMGRIGQRSSGKFRVPLVVRIPYGGGIRAPEQHADSAEAMLVHTPGIKVVVPSTPYDAKGLLYAAVEDPDPVIFLEPIKLYRLGRMEVPQGRVNVPIGPARVARSGDDVSVITWGAMNHLAMEVAEDLARTAGISVEIIDLRTLKPMDTETIAESVQKTGRAIVLHEAPRTAGLGGEVVASIQEDAFWWLKTPVRRVTAADVPYPPFAWEDWYMPTKERLAGAIREALAD
ncbi:MAG: alpha-ketoacid dehydrogenase subunit beta [Firmicutes bacterium]|jgi:pyruvate dehydrogenase E1 component beta subunit|nr:alpha-ketoacid dehydrogenase subunit beta [Bacillota bacterium]